VAEEKAPEFLIIKRSRNEEHAGSHGAWKIAFADFMTAMMALFLVLWLISATSEKTKASLARYFNPVNLVDMTTLKRGIHDPDKHAKTDAMQDAVPPAGPNAKIAEKGKEVPREGSTKHQPPAGQVGHPSTRSEAALFRDPYAVLAEIAAEGAATRAADAPPTKQPNVGAAPNFQDPFATSSPEVPTPMTPQPMRRDSHGAGAGAPPQHDTAAAAAAAASSSQTQAAASEKSAPAQQSGTTAGERADSQASPAATDKSQAAAAPKSAHVADKAMEPAKDQPADVLEAQRLQKEIASAVGKGKAAPDIEVKPTPRGVLISLTDGYDFAMFAVGSAEPAPRTLQVMEKIARILKKESGTIIISGHTDGRRYRSRTYDNWRLSTARAQMALYMLVRGGFDEKRIERIEGAADHDLKVPKNPLAADNRRIEILLRKTKS
jgi:chemotaxis protein MotB